MNYPLRNTIIIFFSLTIYSIKRNIIEKYKCNIIVFSIYEYTFATVSVCVSRITSTVTLTRQFVTGKIITAVTTTVLVTITPIGPVITPCNRFD